jgi:hypothetical protein
MKRNHPNFIDRNRKAIAGVKQHYAAATALVLDGISRTPADIEKILQDQIDAIDAWNAAKVAFHQATAVSKTAAATADAVFLALKTKVFLDFKTTPDTVADFGLTVPKRRKPKPKTLVAADEKRKATIASRHPAGAKAPAEPTGTTPAAPPAPGTHG